MPEKMINAWVVLATASRAEALHLHFRFLELGWHPFNYPQSKLKLLMVIVPLPYCASTPSSPDCVWPGSGNPSAAKL
jgi:hypothetical protein